MHTSITRFIAFCALAVIGSACSPLYEPKEPRVVEHADGFVEVHPPADCPDWSNPHMANYTNTILPNFGCANATNLAVMVEDPADLTARPRRTPSPDAERSAGVVGQYKSSAFAIEGEGGSSQPVTTGGGS